MSEDGLRLPIDRPATPSPTPTNGTKRKSRSSIGKAVNYKDDDSESDGDAPLVC